MFKQVARFVQENHMIEYKERIVVGVSGGADSVSLLLVLVELKKRYDLELFVVHVNHGIRDEEAMRDQQFVEQLCQELGVYCNVYTVDVAAYGQKYGYSLEEAGRILRYDAFEREYKQWQCNKIAIAHNKNDQAETVLFNLVRGTGMKGLSGIEAMRGPIIRPLLCVTREEIEQYLKERNVVYCTDSTNLTDVYTRNKIRLNILPELNKVNEQAVAHICSCAKQLREVELYMEKITNMVCSRIVTEKNGQYFVKIVELQQEEPVLRKRVIRQMIYRTAAKLRDIEEKHIQSVLQLCEKAVGKQVHLPYGILAYREYESIRIGVASAERDDRTRLEIPILKEGIYTLPEQGIHVIFEFLDCKKNSIIPKNGYTKWFDYDKIKNTIFLRNRMQGDYLQINQKGNVKTIKALFIDEKVPKEQRDSIPLLCDGNHVMWVLGGRISEAYKITEQSKKILVVKIMEV